MSESKVPTHAAQTPLDDFSGCHRGIIRNFESLQALAESYRSGEAPSKLKDSARHILDFFEDVVRVHHAEEEEELFTAVLQNLEGEDEETARRARQQIRRLVHEHRELEALWASLEEGLRQLARGREADFDADAAECLARKYLAHARFEEEEFLPLAARILDKSALSALGLSLHLRHQEEFNPYI